MPENFIPLQAKKTMSLSEPDHVIESIQSAAIKKAIPTL
jgi:hypothetical protein